MDNHLEKLYQQRRDLEEQIRMYEEQQRQQLMERDFLMWVQNKQNSDPTLKTLDGALRQLYKNEQQQQQNLNSEFEINKRNEVLGRNAQDKNYQNFEL